MSDDDPIEFIKAEVKKQIGESDQKDASELLASIRDHTVDEVLSHGACGQDGCKICGFKSALDGKGYKRGVIAGTKLAALNPKVDWLNG